MKENEITFHHMRNVGRGSKKRSYTLAMMMTADTVFVGISKCSKLDNFVKAKGRLIAEGRCRKAVELVTNPSEARDYVKWSATFDRQAYNLTSHLIKREVVELVKVELSTINAE